MDLTNLHEVWKDQKSFNQNFFPVADSYQEQSRQTKEFLLHLMSEMDELLRCTEWKPHRKINPLPNREQVKNELTDIFKYFISMCLVWQVNPEELLKDYWRKSMVCQQRYSEEFCQHIDGEVVLVDIDGVLADYQRGIANWIEHHYPELSSSINRCIEFGRWIDATSLGIDDQRWQEIKHHFRTSRGKIYLPVCPHAKEFLETCGIAGYKVVLLTSRPIDQYPNIYMDTLDWLKINNLPFDFLWWAVDKKESILSKNLRTKIKFAIDDDLKYVLPYSRMGIDCFWVDSGNAKNVGQILPANVCRITSLKEVVDTLNMNVKQRSDNASHVG